jgi:hypothetical protein
MKYNQQIENFLNPPPPSGRRGKVETVIIFRMLFSPPSGERRKRLR